MDQSILYQGTIRLQNGTGALVFHREHALPRPSSGNLVSPYPLVVNPLLFAEESAGSAVGPYFRDALVNLDEDKHPE